MRTIRGRLVVGFAVALAVTLFVFAAMSYVVQRPARFAQLDIRIQSEADLIATLVSEAFQRSAGPIIVPDTLQFDPATGEITTRPVLDRDVAALLESVEDYVLVLGANGEIFYTTEAPRAVGSVAQFERLGAVAQATARPAAFGTVNLGAPVGEIRYFVRGLEGAAGPQIDAIFAGAPTAGAVFTTEPLLVGMLLSGPLILIASVLVGYGLVGRNMRPLATIIDEIEAITDGRSLHRRVLVTGTSEELDRLSATLNAMLVRLERNFLSLRRFTADASHELKTPLTVLRAGVERAITHPSVSPELMEVLEETLIEVNRMTEIVDSLLTLARVDEGRAPLHLEPIDFNALVTEVAETANILGEEAGVDVTVSVPDGATVLALDRGRARQLLLNLITNALKYTPRGGRVKIAADVDDRFVRVDVADTGIGIAATDLPHVFDRFWRADAARSRTGQRPGTGLGLAICKWIAEAHGGSIAVQSRKGKGTTFTVRLPRTDEDAASTEANPLLAQAGHVS